MAERLTIAQEEAEAEPPAVVRAILVTCDEVDALHVKYAYALTMSLPGHGVHVDPDAAAHLLGSRRLLFHVLHAGEVLITTAGADGLSWRLCRSGPHHGPGLVLRYNGATDAVADTELTVHEVGEMLSLDDEGDNEEKAHGRQAA